MRECEVQVHLLQQLHRKCNYFFNFYLLEREREREKFEKIFDVKRCGNTTEFQSQIIQSLRKGSLISFAFRQQVSEILKQSLQTTIFVRAFDKILLQDLSMEERSQRRSKNPLLSDWVEHSFVELHGKSFEFNPLILSRENIFWQVLSSRQIWLIIVYFQFFSWLSVFVRTKWISDFGFRRSKYT